MGSQSSQDQLLQQLKTFAEELSQSHLKEYTEYIRRSPAMSCAPKEINDAIWGTIKLRPLEVLVLDSPLVQRLRLIKQLGVVHWVYPGATHARFEHTLGVLYQAQQLIGAINDASEGVAGPVPIDNNRAGLVRLCALLHDLGHGVFSHVSEHALKKNPALSVALARFASENDLSKVQLSEVMAYYMIGSSAFKGMLAECLDRLGQPLTFARGAQQNAERIAQLIQDAIIGKQIDEDVPLLHEIITGPFDADKLDYYVRDARLCGVPSILDLSRLTQKMAVKRVAPRDLPGNIAAGLSNKLDAHHLFGLKWSGASILDELHLARVLLYSKIYRHKKVLAVEAMIDALLDALITAPDSELIKVIELCYTLADDQFLCSSAQVILTSAEIFKASKDLTDFVTDTLARLRNRSLYVLALAIRPSFPTDPWAGEKKQARGLNDLVGDFSNSQKLFRFRARLLDELDTLIALDPSVTGLLDPALVKYSVAISTKSPLGGGTEIDRAYIFQADGIVPYRDLDGVNHPAWADAYDFSSPAGLIYCPREIAAAIYVAAERMIRREYGVILPPSALDMSKQDVEEVTALKRRLEGLGWYSGVPLDIRPMPVRLTRQDAEPRIEAIAAKLNAFDEPIGLIGGRRPPELKGRILNWLAQFRDDQMISCALTMLEGIRLLGREDTHEALSAFLDEYPEFEGATVCPLGELKDSGAVQAYISRDLERRLPKTGTVEEAAERDYEGPVIFLDDFTSSGTQALDIIGHWFGNDNLRAHSLGEERLPFGEKERTYLQSRPVGFVFVAGWDDGVKRITEAAENLGLNAKVYAHLTEADIPFAFEGTLKEISETEVQQFRDRCRHIGKELLKSNGKSDEKQESRALGYGNRAMLLASRLNMPTQSMTCIWMDGQVDGVDWHALMRRREKH